MMGRSMRIVSACAAGSEDGESEGQEIVAQKDPAVVNAEVSDMDYLKSRDD